ncbi:hypothetical protein L226DRAFT_532953 [Lentinus tigrinus ALCF2SS1-7]|uniref:uncharacterized protein n=1 Tax=Lentinus tigrinus ALCF2SS1-7 TaxID=1328758 RepID=UPI001165D184|nr:hypothetical protein L226DRAFT_532953 [Lentinus tigrinus ALCF2SS1-7]
MDAFFTFHLTADSGDARLESDAFPTADPLPSQSPAADPDTGVPIDFEYTNNNYSHSWCTIA